MFIDFREAVKKRIDELTSSSSQLYRTGIDGYSLWDHYLASFPEGSNPIYRERTEHDCSSCRHFIRDMGNVVAIVDGEVKTIWDVENLAPHYQAVADAMAERVREAGVVNVFIPTEKKIGVKENRELSEDGTTILFSHFHCSLPSSMVITNITTANSKRGALRDNKNVFKRSMDELTLEAGQIILELIEQGSLYRGTEFKSNISKFIEAKRNYNAIPEEGRDLYAWEIGVNSPIARIRNTAIGTLLIDISEGVDLETAVRKYEAVVAPSNYKRPTALITARMIEEAEGKIVELGYENSLSRRAAVLEDISVNDVLYVNRDASKKMKGSLLQDLKDDLPANPKSFDKVEEVSIDKFIAEIMPKCSNIELLMESRLRSNLMGLVSPVDSNAPSMLKWGNNFSWSYAGGVADSMKERVKSAGGKVDGVLRFSIQWNEDGVTRDDYDAHCESPVGHIYFSRKKTSSDGGNLDVDITSPGKKVAVENITWPNLSRMQRGQYKFYVHNYSKNCSNGSGFTAEIEFGDRFTLLSFLASLIKVKL